VSVESVPIGTQNPGVTPTPRRNAKPAVQPQPQPTNPTVPFGVGAAVGHGGPPFSIGPLLKVSWSAPAGSEPVTYDPTKFQFDTLTYIEGENPTTALTQAGTTDTSALTSTLAGQTYCFNVREHDLVGNESYYGEGACTTMPRRSKNLTKSGSWTEKNGSAHYGGGYSQATHGSLSLKAYRKYNAGYGWVSPGGGIEVGHVALVATRCRGCGTVKVTYRLFWKTPNDGTKRSKSVNLNAASDKPAQIIPLFSFPNVDLAQHLEVKIEITSGRKPVRIEGLGVSRF
jgi:hypothetical protein